MKMEFKQTVVAIAVIFGLSVSFNSNAEVAQPTQSAPTINQRDAQIAAEKQAEQMTSAAIQVLNLIDQGKSGEIWEGLSSTIQPKVSKNTFTQRIAENQSTLGAPSKRQQISAYRSEANGQSNIPKGIYYSVIFETNFAKGQGRELVSFRFDNDQVWRVAGYSLTRTADK